MYVCMYVCNMYVSMKLFRPKKVRHIYGVVKCVGSTKSSKCSKMSNCIKFSKYSEISVYKTFKSVAKC